jgi:hypothetical protein
LPETFKGHILVEFFVCIHKYQYLFFQRPNRLLRHPIGRDDFHVTIMIITINKPYIIQSRKEPIKTFLFF